MSGEYQPKPLSAAGRAKMQRRLCSVVLTFEGFVVFFGALVASRISDRVSSGQALALGGLLALGCVLATGSLRSRYGLALGWLMQALVLATGVVVPAMFAMGVLFGALWVGALRVGKMVATAGEGPVSSR